MREQVLQRPPEVRAPVPTSGGVSIAPASADVRPRRVLFLGHTAMMGGAEVALLRLVLALDISRYVPVVLLFSEGPLARTLRAANIECHVLPANERLLSTSRHALGPSLLLRGRDLLSAGFFIPRLARKIRALQVDLVQTNSLKADVLGSLASKLAGKPLLWYVHNRIAEDYMPPHVVRFIRFLGRRLPQLLVANSRSTLENLEVVPGQQSAIVYPGIDPQDFPQRRVARWGGGDAPVIGIMGRISPTKGQDIFLRAAALVRRIVPNARFRIIGAALFNEIEYEADLQALICALRFEHSLEMAGFTSDIPGALQDLSILVHASTVPEPFGQVIIEGMAAGLPVIASDAGGVREIMVHNQTGMLVPPGNVQALAMAMEYLLKHPAVARRLGDQAREHVLQHFTVQQMAGQMQKTYDALLATN